MSATVARIAFNKGLHVLQKKPPAATPSSRPPGGGGLVEG
jgi:hypothetical protein